VEKIVYEQLIDDIETTEERQSRIGLQMAYRNAFNQDGRKVLKDRLNELGLFRMIDVGNEGDVILHNEAIRLLLKLGILVDGDSINKIIDAIMDLPVTESKLP
jgi:hypothetical protein